MGHVLEVEHRKAIREIEEEFGGGNPRTRGSQLLRRHWAAASRVGVGAFFLKNPIRYP